MSEQVAVPETVSADPVPRRKVLLAAGAGHFVEWFDMGIYGTLSTVIAANFFAAGDPAAALLSTFAVFAAGFVIRPLGGLFFGPLADRIGRQRVLAIVVLTTSLATFAIGVLPTYHAVGALAPLLLVVARLVQGFAAGGETSSAVTVLYEYAPKHRRGFFSSFADTFGFAAFVFGSGLALLLTASFGDATMTSWAWRLPFLLALPLGLAGLYLRLKLQDTPEFRELEAKGEVTESPVRETFRTGGKAMLVLAGLVVIKGVAHWTLQTFMPSYLQTTLHFTKVQSFIASTVCLAVVAVAVPFAGALSDRIGRRPLLIAGTAGFIVLTWPSLLLMSLGNTFLAVLGMVVLGLLIAAYDGAVSATMAELFPPRIRSGAIAIPYNIAVSLFGGTAPYIATWLISASGYRLSPAFYVMLTAAITLVTVLRVVRETAGPKARVVA
ncbi:MULTISPECIES: MFS transporter [Amycolatopsis]|uniref:MFS transporter n=1 Tax=Amycolatopsis thermalba TaxID=944492 RepID=A0ABY4P3G8_9PSEU|nr:MULTISPECIES: MFS transporter [Amycolatopsis]OXM71471.1 MFS transporter [Amycolatopsis sp. KNN50.9b]UQS26826.1 MFS transporter [Amycolatopsis thermalba]